MSTKISKKEKVLLVPCEISGIDLDKVCRFLNTTLSYLEFRFDNGVISLPKGELAFPVNFESLRQSVPLARDEDYIIVITDKPFINNYYYSNSSFDRVCLASFYQWSLFTTLPKNNGLVYFICDILAFRLEGVFRHNENTGCIYDFLYDKTGIDDGMKRAWICDECLQRLADKDLSIEQKETFSDLRTLLDALNKFSKWNDDITKQVQAEPVVPAAKLPSVFISFNKAQRTFIETLETELTAYMHIIHYKNKNEPWASITAFMKRIRQEDFALLIISDEYLRSINCMYEVSQLVKDDNWLEKVMFYVLDNASCVYDSTKQAKYIAYWSGKKTQIENELQNIPPESREGLTSEYKKVVEILNCIGIFLSAVKDAVNPPENELINAVKKRVKFTSHTAKPISVSSIGDNTRAADVGYSINATNVQVIYNPKGSTIIQNDYHAPNIDVNELLSLINCVKSTLLDSIAAKDSALICDSLEAIETEAVKPTPEKPVLRNAISVLKGIKGTIEFGAAVITLIQFLQTIL